MRQETINYWQKEWDCPLDNTGKHTKGLIPNIEQWINRTHGELEYHLTQILTGHGNFNDFLYKIRKTESPYCDLCAQNEIDTPDHTFRLCSRFNNFRHNTILNTSKSLNEIINSMLADEKTWKYTQSKMKKLMEHKKQKRGRA